MRLRMSKDLTIAMKWRQTSTRHQLRASLEVQGIDQLTIAGHTGILRHLCPSAWKHPVVFGINKRGGRFVQEQDFLKARSLGN